MATRLDRIRSHGVDVDGVGLWRKSRLGARIGDVVVYAAKYQLDFQLPIRSAMITSVFFFELSGKEVMTLLFLKPKKRVGHSDRRQSTSRLVKEI